MRIPILPLAVCGILLLGGPAAADVLVTTLDGKAPTRGISLTADMRQIAVQTAAGPVVQLPTAEVVEIVTVPPPAPLPPTTRPFEVELVDGGRLRGVLRAADKPEEFVTLRSPVLSDAGGSVRIGVDQILAIRRVDGTKIPGASRLVRIEGRDAAYKLSGARIAGTLAQFSNVGVMMDLEDQAPTEVAYRDLAAVFIENDPLVIPDELHAVARLADGSAVLLSKGFRVVAGQLQGTTPSGVSIRAPLARVTALSFRGGRFVHLSDLSPLKVTRTPFFPLPEGPAAAAMLDFVCPVRMDRSPDGRAITLRNHRYFKGIGVRPTTELTFRLDGAFQSFQTLCGIDDEVLGPGYGHGGGTGSAVFVVKVDGVEVHRTEPVAGGREPVDVRVSVAGKKTLSLLVTLVPKAKMPNGIEDSPELDNAVWARPLLIR